MKKLKKIFAFLLCVATIISSLVISTNAISNNSSLSSSNSYATYKYYSNMTNEQLKTLGMTTEEIKYIRDFDYVDEVKSRASLTDDTLYSYGYTQDDIIQLREVAAQEEISEAALYSISENKMKSYVRIKGSGTLSTGEKYVDLAYKFKWKSIPLFCYFDRVAIGFMNKNGSDNFLYYVKSSYNFKYTRTYLSTGTTADITENWIWDTDSANAIYAPSFLVASRDSNGNYTDMCWSGSGKFRLTYQSPSSRLYIDATYGHTIITLSPSFSVGSGGASGCINFVVGVDEQHCCGVFNSDFSISTNYIYDGNVFGKGDTGYKTCL